MQPPLSQQPLTSLPIPPAFLHTIYESDQAIYPVTLPYSRLCDWVAACPDLSICFQSPTGATVGVVIVLPLRRRCWEDLLWGRVKEAEIEAEGMFPSIQTLEEEGEEEVGLHVYHIERFGTEIQGFGRGKRFAAFALGVVMERAVRGRGRWKVVGMSGMPRCFPHFAFLRAAADELFHAALTATPAGKRAFDRLGFEPTGYRELFVTKGADDMSQRGTDKQPLDMVCICPGDESQPADVVGGGVIVSMSEMAVKYGNLSDLIPS